MGTNAPAATRAAPARSPPVARLSLWIGIIASRLQIISQPDADRAWPERAVAAGEEGLRMDIGDRMIVEQVFDISGRGELAARDASIQRHVVVGVGVIVRSEEHTSELQSLMRISYAVFCLKQKNT